MGIRKYKPTTPGRRGSSGSDFVELTRSTPEKSLLVAKPKTGGRNNSGRITTRHIGGGHKQAYRLVDFKRYDKDGVPAKVAHIEYDPNRTARIALLHYADGEKRYILAPAGLKQGTVVTAGEGADIKPGNNLELRQIPVGTTVHAVEMRPGGGAKLGRSALQHLDGEIRVDAPGGVPLKEHLALKPHGRPPLLCLLRAHDLKVNTVRPHGRLKVPWWKPVRDHPYPSQQLGVGLRFEVIPQGQGLGHEVQVSGLSVGGTVNT